LAENNIAFADDPTNQDICFERVRVRKENSHKNLALPDGKRREELAVRAAAFIDENLDREGNALIIQRPNLRDYDAEAFALRYLAAALGGFDYPAPKTVGMALTHLLNTGNRGEAFTAQRSVFIRIGGGISVSPEARHASRPWLNSKVSPFETFCAKSLTPLAHALASKLGAPKFILF
jgi:tRNA(Ile)-lysidine synthase